MRVLVLREATKAVRSDTSDCRFCGLEDETRFILCDREALVNKRGLVLGIDFIEKPFKPKIFGACTNSRIELETQGDAKGTTEAIGV